MIITKTPLRVSFMGGGSDFKNFYQNHKAAVLTSSINKYIYILINKKFDEGLRLSYSVTENVLNASKLKHYLVKEVLTHFNLLSDIEIVTVADIPSEGSGLGSSSAFLVGLINAVSLFIDQKIDKSELAKIACEIEIEKCGAPIGKQDQYASAFGGFNLIEFNHDESVKVTNLNLHEDIIKTINERCFLIYTGITRKSSSILSEQNEDIKKSEHIKTLKKMVSLTYGMRDDLINGDVDSFGSFLNEGWHLKKTINKNISNTIINEMYDKAISLGADGGKLLGAGAGGFLLIYSKKEYHDIIKSEFSNFKIVDFSFEFNGSSIIYNL